MGSGGALPTLRAQPGAGHTQPGACAPRAEDLLRSVPCPPGEREWAGTKLLSHLNVRNFLMVISGCIKQMAEKKCPAALPWVA